MKNLLRRNIISGGPHVNLLKDVKARDDEEDPRPLGSPPEEPAQSEDDGPLVLLVSFGQHDLVHFNSSNTCTTFTTKNKESGKVAAMRSSEHPVRKMEKSPEASSQTAKE